MQLVPHSFVMLLNLVIPHAMPPIIFLHAMLLIHSPCACCLPAVIEGMDLIYKVEGLGSGSGKPKKKVVISDSGELPM